MSVPFRERNPVTIGAVSIAVILLLMLAAFKANQLPLIGGGDTYYASFSDASGIKTNDEVRVAGVRVGKVTGVDLVGGHVRVSFQVRDGVDMGSSTGAQIKVKTLLGQMFLALQPSGSGKLQAGATIPASRTKSAYDIVQAFSGLASRTEKINLGQLTQSLNTLADVTQNTPAAFQGTLKGLSDLSANIAARDAQLNTLLGNARQVTGVLADRNQDVVQLMKDSDVLMRALVARRAAVHRLLVSTVQLSQQLTGLVNDTKKDLKPALDNLSQVVALLQKNQDNLDTSLRLMAPFYRVFANTLGTGPWFDTYIQNIPRCDMTTSNLSKALGAILVIALVVAGYLLFMPGTKMKHVTAEFPRTVSLYDGSDVRILGIHVGSVDSVTPAGTKVIVKMSYDAKYKVPKDAKAVLVSPSIVGDRFIQLTPVYKGGAVMADHTVLSEKRTATPLELDQIYSSINDLSVALGPQGANSTSGGSEGALSRILDSTSRNFGGQGTQAHATIENFSKLTKTLSDNKDNLFGTARELETFVNALSKNDDTVRRFNDSLAQGSDLLAGERQDLAAALRNLSTALIAVRQFVQTNRDALSTNIKGLNSVTQILVKRRTELTEVLKVAPAALNNLGLAYNPKTGTLDQRTNLTENIAAGLSQPGQTLCGLLSPTSALPQAQCTKLLNGLGLKRAGALQRTSTPDDRYQFVDPTLAGLVAVKR